MDGKKKRSKFRYVLSVIFVLFLIAAVSVVVLCRDDLSPEGIKQRLSGLFSKRETADVFYFDAGSEVEAESFGNGLLVASSVGVQIFDAAGSEVCQELFLMSAPAVSVHGEYAVVYDVGGTILRRFDQGGSMTKLDSGQTIISASVNKDGWVTVCAQEEGYRGAVTVYAPDGQAAYKWYSGRRYVISAQVSPDNEKLAVGVITDAGSDVLLFRLDSEEEQACYTAADEVVLSVSFVDEETVLFTSDKTHTMLTLAGTKHTSFDYATEYLRAFAVDPESGNAALLLHTYQVGESGRLCTVNTQGLMTGALEMNETVLSVSVAGAYVAVLTANDLTIYNSDLTVYKEYTNISGVRDVFMRADGSAVLLQSYSAVVVQ